MYDDSQIDIVSSWTIAENLPKTTQVCLPQLLYQKQPACLLSKLLLWVHISPVLGYVSYACKLEAWKTHKLMKYYVYIAFMKKGISNSCPITNFMMTGNVFFPQLIVLICNSGSLHLDCFRIYVLSLEICTRGSCKTSFCNRWLVYSIDHSINCRNSWITSDRFS